MWRTTPKRMAGALKFSPSLAPLSTAMCIKIFRHISSQDVYAPTPAVLRASS